MKIASGLDIDTHGSIPIPPEKFAEGFASVTAHHAEEARQRDCLCHGSVDEWKCHSMENSEEML
jgi:hypothetical protein